MATALKTAKLNGQRPGQHYSLSPVTVRRLRTLPLPFEAEPSSAESHSAESHSQDATSDCANANGTSANGVIANGISANGISADGISADGISADGIQGHGAAAPLGKDDLARQAQRALMAQLSREVKRIEVAGRVRPDQLGRRSAVFSSGSSAIDGCLPCGGYESGTVIEYLQDSAGSGATTLALSTAREALAATDRFCVIVDWRQQFYPPAAAALGLDLQRIIIVRPATLADRLWAIDQALRSPSIVAVIAEVEQLDDRAARRLQLAAESGGSLGLLVRSISRQHHPSWAEVQWRVRPLVQTAPGSPLSGSSISPHRQLQLELRRVRGGSSGSRVQLQINALNGRLEPAPTHLVQNAL